MDLTVARGDLLAIRGPSGSGKTTLFNLLGLLDRPDAGQVLMRGEPVDDLDEDRRADLRRDRFGFVFQTFNLVPVLSAEENVAWPLGLKGTDDAAARKRARELLDQVGLQGKGGVRPDLLSGGERQRVAIARALVNGPEVVLADEPTANLDGDTAAGILDLIEDLNRRAGVAFLLATHDPRVVARARRVVTLADGRIAGDA
ncbi:MAG TPA: ABC transporter ATP-binding protein [Candidatus Polarisedimenticolia bacterium]|nr:ABC transporter ATP-binding protein [Candidatus Polarisedimenticolia bacterium]